MLLPGCAMTRLPDHVAIQLRSIHVVLCLLSFVAACVLHNSIALGQLHLGVHGQGAGHQGAIVAEDFADVLSCHIASEPADVQLGGRGRLVPCWGLALLCCRTLLL